ncbi:receptor-type tyrosine-protein phosphatase T-like isoform X6 [Montipora capricornis]|uniref:receptor-type tyrosine-protein phosphatase T-like isoform X6 n=1 Tax=Montipora capricornis TaxID=246305 RepID=UPI0035F1457E
MFTSRQKMSIMVGDTSYCKALCFQVIFCLLLAHLSSESCEKDALGLEKGFILDGQITSSSDLSPNTPAKNGRLNYTAGSSWCASPSDSFPYLEIDLQSLHIICAVSTQGNSKADQWVKTYSLQSSTDGATWTNYTARGQIGFKSFSGNFNRNTIVKHVLYHGMVGRYVRFVAGSKHVQACLRTEIFGASRRDIKGNVALFKPTDQKSTRGSFFSSYAVDGGKGTNVRFCAHTGDAGNTNPFWRVDLGRVEHVAEVRILNRDCCADRLDGAEIRVGDSTAMGGATNHVCATVTRIPVKEEKQFFCKPIASGRYVSIRIAGHPKDVVICEVEVYSTFTHNLALNQPAEQVSIAHGGVASRAVDGDRRTNYPSGTCTHTDFAKDAWWRVDLGASVPVAEVVIVNRYCRPQLECVAFMDSFQIKIGNNTSTNTGCGGTLSMVTGETKSFYCYPPIVGRYVSVVVPGVRKILTICEVEVYSTPQTSNGVTACRANPVGISNSTVICNHRFSASSSLGSSFLPSKGRFNGASAWIPSSTNNNTDYLQIDLGSVYFVCAVATQGNPSADDWTKTYKIETSLDNANWQMYQENNTVKIFSGNSGQNFSVKSDFYNPLAVKFIRFYPVAFNSRKALRVEVYGSTQGCLSTVGNERGVDPRPFSVTASSELDGTHTQAHSHLYGITSWCSRVVAPPQYLQFDFGKVITVSGIATQGDDVVDKWVTGYGISYGYDGRSWLSYNIGQPLIGNVDRRSVVVRWFSLPFAAQFVRILPKTYHNGLCMRVELFGCKDFQIAFLFVHVDDGTLLAANSATITLNCVTKSSKKLPRAISYEWRKNGVKLDESSSSLTIKYSDASDINNNYRCARLNSSRRQVQCHAIYQCSASLETDAGAPYITSQGNSTVTVTLQVPGKPTVGVTTIGARTAIVTWSYTPGVDEAPVNSFTLQYQTHTFIILPGSSSRKELTNLKPCTSYSVTIKASSVLGDGFWSDAKNFTTATAPPSPPSDVKTGPADKRSITLFWQKPKISGDDVQMYTVICKGTKSYYPDFTDSRTVKTKALSKEFTNLYPDTKYDFVVFATTGCGDGDNSSMVTTHTLIAAPAAPKNPVETQKFDTTGSSVNLTIWPADQDNGRISYYQVLVHRVEDWTDNISEWNNFGSDFYVSAQIPASAVNPSMTFVLGDGEDKGGFTNKKLSRGQKYNVYSRATTAKSKKRSTDEQFLTGPAKLLAQIDVKAVASNLGNESVEKSSPIAAITSAVVIVVLVGVVIAGIVIWRRRRRQDQRSSKTNESHLMTQASFNDAYDTVRPDGGGSRPRPPSEEEPGETVEATADPIYGNTAADDLDDKPKPIPVSQFSEYVTQLKREKNAGFAKQYKLLAQGQQFSWDDAKKPGNKNKNRYANIIAYDHSRVTLPIIDGSENSDYINASYLHGYDGTPKTYIACQGPVPGTYQDFWRMIWQENATTIVMLTRLVEHGRTKCHQYWPEKSESYHDVIVKNHKTETFADYAIRTFTLSKGSEDKRQVQQFHFLVWPDKGVPRHATAVLGLRRKVRMKHHDSRTPLVVHCSAGVGRTGAFIVIDAMLESIKKKKVVDVFNYVQLLRNNRISMVQTEEQYGFIYMALLESVTCGNTEIAAHDIRIAVKKLAAVNPKTKTSGLGSEYQRLDLITADDVTDIEDDIGRKHENASKNRFPDIIPLNGSRVVLKDGRSDYINAAFVDTFRERNSYIMTQAPLDNTIEDFWKMIWDYDVGTIVTLNEPKERGQIYPVYWASEGSTTFGEFTIETTSYEVFQDFSERELTVKRKKDPNTVRQIHQYQVTGWPDKGVPKNAHCIIDLINMVERSQRKSSNAPLVVQCSDGVGRSGTFCAILSIIERLKSEQVIDVFQSVKVIRVNRPKAVNCKAQYVFCYNIVQRYLDSFNDYSNFN